MEPSCVSIINGYRILIIGGNDAKIYIIYFTINEIKITNRILAVLDTDSKNRDKFYENQNLLEKNIIDN